MTCLKCGECCKGFSAEEGFIWLSQAKYRKLEKFHELKSEDLGLLGIIIKIPPKTDCPYLTKDNLCEIHDSKPLVCTLYACQKNLDN